MRNFINDHRLLSVLDLIESHLEQPISVEANDNVEIAGVQYLDGRDGFLFLHNPNIGHVNNDVVFHELMHISLHIEGWPTSVPSGGMHDLESMYGNIVADKIISIIWNLCPHTEIWLRERACGFSHFQEEYWNEDIRKMTIPYLPVLGKAWCQYLESAQNEVVPIQALGLVQSWLAPASHDLHEQLQKAAEAHLPQQALSQVHSICQEFVEHKQSFPQSIPLTWPW